MAMQTRTQRQAAAKKAAATRKRNTSRQGARTAALRLSAEKAYLDAIARRGERAVLIQVGAALEARDRIVALVRIFGDGERLRSRLTTVERRGATSLPGHRRAGARQAKEVRSGVGDRANGFQERANDVVERVRSIT